MSELRPPLVKIRQRTKYEEVAEKKRKCMKEKGRKRKNNVKMDNKMLTLRGKKAGTVCRDKEKNVSERKLINTLLDPAYRPPTSSFPFLLFCSVLLHFVSNFKNSLGLFCLWVNIFTYFGDSLLWCSFSRLL